MGEKNAAADSSARPQITQPAMFIRRNTPFEPSRMSDTTIAPMDHTLVTSTMVQPMKNHARITAHSIGFKTSMNVPPPTISANNSHRHSPNSCSDRPREWTSHVCQ